MDPLHPPQEIVVLSEKTIAALVTAVIIPIVSLFVWIVRRSVPAKKAIEDEHEITRKEITAMSSSFQQQLQKVRDEIRADIDAQSQTHRAEVAEYNRDAREQAALNAVLAKTVGDIKEIVIASANQTQKLRETILDQYQKLREAVAGKGGKP